MFGLASVYSLTSSVFAGSWDRITTGQGMFARFCDETKEEKGASKFVRMVVSPGKTANLCVDLLNNNDVPYTMHVAFLDGYKDTVSDAMWCDNWSSKFWQYVTGYDTFHTIPANSFKRINVNIKMPVAAAWTVYGCVSVFNEDVWQAALKLGGVTTLLRNTIPVELFVDSKVEVGLELAPVRETQGDNLVSDPVLFAWQQQDKSYLVAVGFKNTGGLDETVEVAGTIKDILGKTITLDSQTKTVGPDGYGDVRYALPKLPWYQMWFDVDMTITHNAVSEFRTEFITEQLLAKKTLTVHDTFFVFPRWIVVALLLLILIIMWIRHMVKRAHAHHQQEKDAMAQLQELQKWKQEHESVGSPGMGTPPQA